MREEPRPVLTIGHSTHPVQRFVELLQRHGVTAVSDVRSTPFSRFNPQFNKEALERSLKACGIKYVFLGRELGARSEDPSCYENGRVQYSRLARTELFKSGLDRVVQGARKYRIALMCAERDPLECHRALLVGRALVERGIEVGHILADGTMEPHPNMMARLLDVVGLPREDLFRSREQLIEEAMTRQEDRIAYVDGKLAGESLGSEP
jgi:uncharacterized protein (DUF488 family)